MVPKNLLFTNLVLVQPQSLPSMHFLNLELDTDREVRLNEQYLLHSLGFPSSKL